MKIMSISPGGNLKIIKDDRIDLTGYSGVSPNENYRGIFDESGATGRRTSGYCSNVYAQQYGCNAWGTIDNFANNVIIGANYNSSGPVIEDAELNTYLNSTYKNNLSDLTYVQPNMIWNVGHAGANNDAFSVSQLEDMEKAYTWNGDIALPTKSEYIRAHGNVNCSNAKYLYDNYQSDTCKISNYLYKSDYRYWLLSPFSTSTRGVFIALSDYVDNYYANGRGVSVLPVLYLKSNITLSGNGGQASEDMYRIVS